MEREPDMNDTARRFRELHADGCFLLPNPWDVGGARVLEQLGFEALASSSAALAFAHGLPDRPDALSLELVLEHLATLAAATSLPLNADFQAGYAATPEGVAENVERCVATGVAGLSIEDARGDGTPGLYELSEAVERVAAARAALDAVAPEVVLTGRAERFLVDQPDLDVVITRLTAYADAGADCLFAPGLTNAEQIREVVAAVAPKPVNVLVAAPIGLSLGDLAELGVRRVSLGSALSRVTWGALLGFAQQLRETGRFDGLAGAASFADLNARFERDA